MVQHVLCRQGPTVLITSSWKAASRTAGVGISEQLKIRQDGQNTLIKYKIIRTWLQKSGDPVDDIKELEFLVSIHCYL